MPKFRVTDTTGIAYEVEAPEGATRAQIVGSVRAQAARDRIEKRREEYDEWLRSDADVSSQLELSPENEWLFGKGVGRGIDLVQQMWGSAAEGIGRTSGIATLQEYGKGVIERNERDIADKASSARSLKDIEGIGSFADWASATLGEQVPQLGTTLAGSVAGAAVGSVIPIPFVGTAVGAIIGGMAVNLPFFYGSNREAQKEAIDQGLRYEISEGAAALTALPQSFLDQWADRFLISGFTDKAIKGGGILTRGVVGAGKGVLTEVPTEVGQEVLQRMQAGQDLWSPEAMDAYVEVAAAAALVGGAVKSTGEMIGGRTTDDTPMDGQLELPFDEDLGTPPGPTPYAGGIGPTIGAAEQLAAGRAEEARRQVTPEEEEYANQRTMRELETRRDELNKLEEEDGTEAVQAERDRIFYSNIDQYRRTQAAEQPDLFPADETVERTDRRPEAPEGATREEILPGAATAATITQEGRQPDLFPTVEPSERVIQETLETPGQPRALSAFGLAARRSEIDRLDDQTLRQIVQQDRERDPVNPSIDAVVAQETLDKRIRPEGQQELFSAEDLGTQPPPAGPVSPPAGPVGTVTDPTLDPAPGPVTPEVPEGAVPTARQLTKKDTVGLLPRTKRFIGKSINDKEVTDALAADVEKLERDKTKEGISDRSLKTINKKLERIRTIQKEGLPTELAEEYAKEPIDETVSTAPTGESAVGPKSGTGRTRTRGAARKRATAGRPTAADIKEATAATMGRTPNRADRSARREGQFDPTLVYTASDAADIKNIVKNVGANLRKGRTASELGRDDTQPERQEDVFESPEGIQAEEAAKDIITVATPTKTRRRRKKKVPSAEKRKAAEARKRRQEKTKEAQDDQAIKETEQYVTDDKGNVHTVTVLPTRGAKGPLSSGDLQGRGRDKGGEFLGMPEEAQVPVRQSRKLTDDQIKANWKTLREKDFKRIGGKLLKEGVEKYKWKVSRDFSHGGLVEEFPWYHLEGEEGTRRFKSAGVGALSDVMPKIKITNDDANKILALMKGAKPKADKGGKGSQGLGAYIFFSKYQDPVDNILHVINSSVWQQGEVKKEGDIKGLPEEDRIQDVYIEAFEAGTSEQNAEMALEWMRNNLSEETNLWVSTIRDNHLARKTKDGEIAKTNKLLGLDNTNAFARTNAPQIADAIAKLERATTEQLFGEEYVDGLAEIQDIESRDVRFLSPNEQMEIAGTLAELKKSLKKMEDETARQNKLREARIKTRKKGDKAASNLTNNLSNDAVVDLGAPLGRTATVLLKQGKLAAAMRALARSSNSHISKVATALSTKLGNTKVEVVKNLKDKDGKRVAGLFHPKTNTIQMDSVTGMNPHTLLHETTHALTSHILADAKSSALAKRLQKLYNDSKDMLDTAYGAENLDEFVAEAFSNPEFQQKLAGINPKNSPVTSLQRFFHAIVNMVRSLIPGMQPRPLNLELQKFNTVKDATEALIYATLSPAPESRNAGSMALGSRGGRTVDRMLDGFAARAKSMPPLDSKLRKKYASDFGVWLSTISGNPVAAKMKAYSSRLLPLQGLTDVAVWAGIKSAPKLLKAVHNQFGTLYTYERRLDAAIQHTIDWTKKQAANNPKLVTKFDRLVYRSTREQVDPSYTREEAIKKYKNKKTGTKDERGKPKDKFDVWQEMQSDWGAIGEGGRKSYTDMRDEYQALFTRLKAVISSRITNMKDKDGKPVDKATREKLQKDIYDKLFNKGRIEPYFPLTRKGDFWLEFEGTDPETGQAEMVYMAFEGPVARKRFIKELVNNPAINKKSIKPYQRLKQVSDLNKAPATSFMSETLKVLDKNGVDGKVQLEFMNLFLNALPESSFAKSLTRRANEGKGKLGFNEDALGAFRTKAYDLASATARLKHGQEISDVEAEIEAEFEKGSKGTRRGNVYDAQYTKTVLVDELKKRADFARNPPEDRIYMQANRLAFLYTIGFNISSALVNLTQVPLMMQPMLGGKYGHPATAKAIWETTKLLGGSHTTRKISPLARGKDAVKVRGAYSIDNYFTEDPNEDGKLIPRAEYFDKMPKDKAKKLMSMQTLVEEAMAQGQLNRSLFYDTIGITQGGRDKSVVDRANAMSAWMFHHVERYNRQVGLITTYNLELERLNSDKATQEEKKLSQKEKEIKAANEAIYETQRMNGGAFLASAPGWAQKGVGRVAMMYKSYGVQMYWTLLQTGNQVFRVDLPKNLREQGIPAGIAKTMGDTAFRQLVGVSISSFGLAGVQGLPFIGMLMAIANIFIADEDDDAETIVRKFVNEGFYKGPLVEATEMLGFGTDIASRVGMGNLIIRMNPYGRDDSTEEKIFEVLGGPFLSTVGQIKRGVLQIKDGEYRKGIENMIPTAFRNMLKMERYADEGIKTKREDVIFDDITTGNLVAQFFGFAPSEYTRIMEENRVKKRIDKATNLLQTEMTRELYAAFVRGDTQTLDRILLKDIPAYNKKFPLRTPIGPKTIMKSLRGHFRTTATRTHNGIILSPQNIDSLPVDYFDRRSSIETLIGVYDKLFD